MNRSLRFLTNSETNGGSPLDGLGDDSMATIALCSMGFLSGRHLTRLIGMKRKKSYASNRDEKGSFARMLPRQLSHAGFSPTHDSGHRSVTKDNRYGIVCPKMTFSLGHFFGMI